MPVLETKEFGDIEYSPGEAFDFPGGLPAFERHTGFVLVRPPWAAPLCALQSCHDPNLRFWALPAELAHPAHRLPERRPGLLTLLLMAWTEDGVPTVNLLAPVVLDTERRQGRQFIQFDSGLSPCQPLEFEKTPCS